MQKRNQFSRVFLLFALLCLLCTGIFLPRVESVDARPLFVCPDPTIAEWTFLGDIVTTSTGTGTFDSGTGLNPAPPIPPANYTNFVTGISGVAPDRAISFSNWSTSNLDTTDYVEFEVSTIDRTSIVFNFGYRRSSTGPLSLQVSYSTDGSSFVDFGLPTTITFADTWYTQSINLGSVSILENQASVFLRIYGYSPTGSIGPTAAGTLRFDNVTITGSCFTPTPTESLTPSETFTPSLTFTPSETFTPSLTFTASQTFTPSQTSTPTSTPTITNTPICNITNTTTPLSLVINEIAWAGTVSSTSDEWIEIFNPPGGVGCVILTGWVLRSADGSPTINLSGQIPEGGYFLLERSDNNTISDIVADQIYNGDLSNSGEVLYLENNGERIDTANIDAGAWPAGSTTNFRSMERLRKNGVIGADTPNNWITNTGVVKNGLDSGLPAGCTPGLTCTTNPRPIYGTPRGPNWASMVTPTASRSPTPTRTATRPPTAVPIGRPVINEFLARPGFDWNQDGTVDVFDEFIEVKNLGPVDINLNGWKLDDEANLGSDPFTLPSITLKPGERHVFYGLETNILLSDGGDTVRLLNSANKVYDSYTYSIAKVEDKSVCRIIDGNGNWYEDCNPTPSLKNSREGETPSMPDGIDYESPVCSLPDTLPADFLFAECRGYGANVWRAMLWDATGWDGALFIPGNKTKWESFVE